MLSFTRVGCFKTAGDRVLWQLVSQFCIKWQGTKQDKENSQAFILREWSFILFGLHSLTWLKCFSHENIHADQLIVPEPPWTEAPLGLLVLLLATQRLWQCLLAAVHRDQSPGYLT